MTTAHALNRRTIALVGLMGSGKSSIGRRLAAVLDMPFRDADAEVESAAGQLIPDIFANLGEGAFREGERKVIARLLDYPPQVLATGGGAFMNHETRDLIKRNAVSVWLKVDVDVMARRVGRKDNRPLLAGRDPAGVLRSLAEVRNPVYALADVTVETGDIPHKTAVDSVIAALRGYYEKATA